MRRRQFVAALGTTAAAVALSPSRAIAAKITGNKAKWNVGWTKSGAIVDQKVGGKYWMYFLADAADHTHPMGVGVWMIYNGAGDKLAYAKNWALFDASDPTRVLAFRDADLHCRAGMGADRAGAGCGVC